MSSAAEHHETSRDEIQLERSPLPRILLRLHRDAFSGESIVSCDGVTRRILFREGLPVHTESNVPSESLAGTLMDSGRLSRADFSKVIEHVEQHGCREGVALLELGLLDARALFQALKEHVRSRVMACFAWNRGTLVSDPALAPAPETHVFRTDLYLLLQEGIAGHWSRERTLFDLAQGRRKRDAGARCGSAFDRIQPHLRVDASVEALLGGVREGRRLSELEELSSSPLALGALWVLQATNAIRLEGNPARGSSPLFNSAISPPDRVPGVEIEIVQEPAPDGPTVARSIPEPRTSAPATTGAPAVAEEIERRWAQHGQWTHYECLGVSEDATPDEVKRVYRLAAKTFHPDALARLGLDEELRQRASRVFAEIGRAHAVLHHPHQRAEYDASLCLGGTDEEVDAQAVAHAESLFRKGQVLCQQGNFRGALAFLKPAVEAWEPEAAYQSLFGWALYKSTPPDPDAALIALERAAELDACDGVTQFRLGVVLRCLGRAEQAQAAFDQANRLEPVGS